MDQSTYQGTRYHWERCLEVAINRLLAAVHCEIEKDASGECYPGGPLVLAKERESVLYYRAALDALDVAYVAEWRPTFDNKIGPLPIG